MTLQISERGFTEQSASEAQLIQLCFTVADLDAAVQTFSRIAGAGPWFRVPSLPKADDFTTYRGVRKALGADIALAYAGNTMYELVAPHEGAETIFSEWVTRFGHGLHHFGYATEKFDRDLRDLKTSGVDPVMTSVTARGARVAMVEGKGPLNVLHELIEITPTSKDFYDRLHRAGRHWSASSELYTDLAL